MIPLLWANGHPPAGRQARQHGERARPGLWSFIKHYVFKRGFLDGWAGFVIAFGNFESTFYRYAKRMRRRRIGSRHRFGL